MKRLSFVILLLNGMFAITGCTRYWYHESKSFEECNQACQNCRSELFKRSDLGNMNDQYEIDYMEDCMIKKGYRSVGQNELPLDVKRQEPDSSLHWRLRGIAGILSEQ